MFIVSLYFRYNLQNIPDKQMFMEQVFYEILNSDKTVTI